MLKNTDIAYESINWSNSIIWLKCRHYKITYATLWDVGEVV